MRILYLLLFLSFGFQRASAQDLNQALQDLRKQYAQSDQLRMVMQIQAFEKPQSDAPYYHEKAEIRKSGNQYLYQFAGTEMLMNAKYLIVVDKNAAEMVCSKRNLKTEADFKDQAKVNIDSILTFYDHPQYLGRTKSIDHYRVFQKKGAIGQIDLFMNAQTNLLHRIQYHYRDKQWVVIAFDVFDMRPSFSSNTFDEAHYVAVEKGKMKPSAAYKKYSIVEASSK